MHSEGREGDRLRGELMTCVSLCHVAVNWALTVSNLSLRRLSRTLYWKETCHAPVVIHVLVSKRWLRTAVSSANSCAMCQQRCSVPIAVRCANSGAGAPCQ